MSRTVLLRFTITGTYEAESKDYDTADADRMAEIDQDEIDSGAVSLHDVLEWANERDLTIKVRAA